MCTLCLRVYVLAARMIEMEWHLRIAAVGWCHVRVRAFDLLSCNIASEFVRHFIAYTAL